MTANVKPLILVGGGGHCKSVIDVIESIQDYKIFGILDSSDKVNQSILGYNIIGTDNDIPGLIKKHYHFLITLGQIKTPVNRIRIFHEILRNGGNLATIISNRAIVSRSAKIGRGSIIMHNAIVNAAAIIGNNTIINTAATIEHDCVVGDHCHISTHAVLNGNVIVGRECFIGSNSTVLHGIKIDDQSIIGAGALVNKHINAGKMIIGNPGREK